jgi:hypothetical protein
MKKVYILASVILMGQPCWAQIREFQTTRLNSTAGAGVASILSTEAAILNPASAAFFTDSNFSYHNTKTTLRHKSDERETSGENFPNNNRSQGYFMTDQSGPVKGGLTYIKQNENSYERTLMALHTASTISEKASAGFSYRYIQDQNKKISSTRHRIRHQMTFGSLFILDTKTSLGLTFIDPTRAVPGAERVIGGIQYAVADKLTLIADFGTQYTKSFSKSYLWRGAVQLTLFNDFFVRAGNFYDNISEFKGTAWGISWIGPRLGLEFSQRFSDQFGQNTYLYKDEGLVDTSISAIIKF